MQPLLVLWDVDFTLADTDGFGSRVYQRAFEEMFGGRLPRVSSMAGRTDRAIVLEVLRAAGVTEPYAQVTAFQEAVARHAPGMADEMRTTGRALPGAAAAIAALAALAAISGRQIVQSLLTGNIRELAEAKLGPLGLTERLDLEVGAYGTESEVRADLVGVARARAAARYSADFSGSATVLIGDTPLDMEAAVVSGARGVGVATGSFSLQQLIDADADAALPDLANTPEVVAAITGDGRLRRRC